MIKLLNRNMIARMVGRGKSKSYMIFGFILANNEIQDNELMYLKIKSEQYKESILLGFVLSSLLYLITNSYIYYTTIPIMYYLIRLIENLVSSISNKIPPMEMEALDNMNDPDYLIVRKGLGFLRYY